MAAKAAAEGASPLHTEPQTPEIAPGELRSPSFPVSSSCSITTPWHCQAGLRSVCPA